MTSTTQTKLPISRAARSSTGVTGRLPEFPHFKPIEFSDKDILDSTLQTLGEVSSDFNFNSFYSWDTLAQNQVATLRSNLVFRFTDYRTGELLYSVLGTNHIEATFNDVFNYLLASGAEPKLKLITKNIINTLSENHSFEIIEDPNNADYIFSLAELSKLEGKKFKNKRQAAKKCEALGTITIEDRSNDPAMRGSIISLLHEWGAAKQEKGKEVDLRFELTAVNRILENLTIQDNLLLTIAKDQTGKLVGYSIDELLPNKHVLSHYFKTTQKVVGLSEYFNQKVAEKLYALNYEYWNWEQDLGIESLSMMKSCYRPCRKHMKYIVTPKAGLQSNLEKLFIKTIYKCFYWYHRK